MKRSSITSMKSGLVAVLFILLSAYCHGQNFSISGSITDGYSGEALIGASVYDPAGRQGTSANTYGFYSLTLPKGT